MIYNYLTTIFKLIAGLVTKEFIGIIAVVFMAILALWIVLSLTRSAEIKLNYGAKKLTNYIDSKKVNLNEDVEFYKLLNDMPPQFVRAFKTLQASGGDLPGKYLTQTECVETPLYGGLFNQNRSLMRTVTNFFVFIVGLLSLAVSFSQAETVTLLTVAESLVMPVIALLVYRIEFYIYASIRQYYYRSAVIRFGELVDALSDNYERGNLVFGECQENCDWEEGELAEEKRMRGRPKKDEPEKSFLIIENDDDFARSLSRAEKLVNKLNSKELSASQIRRTNHELSELMASLADYKKRRK